MAGELSGEDRLAQALAGLDQVAGAKVKLDELFVQWLSIPQTGSLIMRMIEDAKGGRPLPIPTIPLGTTMTHVSKSSASSSPIRGRTSSPPPPRSPSRSPGLTRSPNRTPESKSPSSPTPEHFTFGLDAPAVPPLVAKPSDEVKRGDESGNSSPAPCPPPLRGLASHVPPFYKAGEGGRGRGKPIAGETLEQKLPSILDTWRKYLGDSGLQPSSRQAGAGTGHMVDIAGVRVPARELALGLPVEQFAAVAKTLCGFPSFFAAPLFRRVRLQFDATWMRSKLASSGAPASGVVTDADVDTDGTVSLELFLQYWKVEMEPYDHCDRFFNLVKAREASAIVAKNFMPLLEELLAFHPGLAFLEGTPEFQEKYAKTVTARIMCNLDPYNKGYVERRSLRRSNVIHAFHAVDMEEDINLVNEYFSYEHFYVLYCKFWELDSDRDFMLTRQDLSRMDNLTHVVLDRVFSQAGRPFSTSRPDRMGYEDFICFLLFEEDKTNELSLAYWFRVVDLNGDGKITPDEMLFFYTEQMQRMADLNLEVVPFDDILSQMTDLLKPAVPGEFRFEDFTHPTRIRLTGAFFSILFNLHKFTLFEQRDPVIVKQELNEQGISQWDRFAQFEYLKLAEDEESAGGNDETELSMDLEGMSVGDFQSRG